MVKKLKNWSISSQVSLKKEKGSTTTQNNLNLNSMVKWARMVKEVESLIFNI